MHTRWKKNVTNILNYNWILFLCFSSVNNWSWSKIISIMQYRKIENMIHTRFTKQPYAYYVDGIMGRTRTQIKYLRLTPQVHRVFLVKNRCGSSSHFDSIPFLFLTHDIFTIEHFNPKINSSHKKTTRKRRLTKASYAIRNDIISYRTTSIN